MKTTIGLIISVLLIMPITASANLYFTVACTFNGTNVLYDGEKDLSKCEITIDKSVRPAKSDAVILWLKDDIPLPRLSAYIKLLQDRNIMTSIEGPRLLPKIRVPPNLKKLADLEKWLQSQEKERQSRLEKNSGVKPD